MIKGLIKRSIKRLGYNLTRTPCGCEVRRVGSPGWTPEYLQKLGQPNTIVDVGVGFGTSILYEAFPRAYHVLIEPLSSFKPYLEEILKKYNGKYFLAAVGAKKELGTIFVDSDLQRTSLMRRTIRTSTGNQLKPRQVQVTTLDALQRENNFKPPFGLKIDTEGLELHVIEGASSFLRDTEFVIAEISVGNRFENSYSFAEFINIMNLNGFKLTNFLRIGQASSRVEIGYVDGVFKKSAE